MIFSFWSLKQIPCIKYTGWWIFRKAEIAYEGKFVRTAYLDLTKEEGELLKSILTGETSDPAWSLIIKFLGTDVCHLQLEERRGLRVAM